MYVRVIPVTFMTVALAFLGALGGRSLAAEAHSRGALMTASDGNGGVRLIWFAADGSAPAAWRLEVEAGGQTQVLEGNIPAVGTPALHPTGDPGSQPLRQVFADMTAMSDWALAQKRGVARELHGVPAGERRFRVVPLRADGSVLGAALQGRIIDSHKADPLPPAANDLRIVAVRGGAGLFWQPGKAPRAPPGIAWLIERDGERLGNGPVVLGESWPAQNRAFFDGGAPLETDVRYRVAPLDVFGRAGPWTGVSAFIEDIAARDPPTKLSAAPARGAIELRWDASENAHTSGYVVERAVLRGGPYEVVTPDGLARTTTSFLDEGPVEDTWYFYRLRAMDPRGVLGEPSLPTMARIATTTVPRPGTPRTEVGRSRVILRWDPLPGVAGYYLQRRTGGSRDWRILNDPITPEPRYDDTGLPSGGSFDYRVVAVGHDNRESVPGEAVSVTLADDKPPGAPRIVAADGAGGQARLRFAPAGPAGDSARFLVLRGASAEDAGVVLGDPLPGTAREWADDWVLAGETYWYRLVAMDAAGNRSAPGAAVAVRIGTGPIPAPPAPRVRNVTEPFSAVELRITGVPPGMAILVQRREGTDSPWRVVAGPVTGELAFDAAAPQGRLEYRLVYQARDGSQGPASPPVSVSRP